MFFKSKRKVFCIGRNKTGTTSMERALGDLGYKVAPQSPAELLTGDWSRRSFHRLVRFCRDYEAFQDIPFSLPYTYIALDQAFPGAKFILTVRDNPEVWLQSMIRFMQKFLALDRVPTAQDMKDCAYRGDALRKGELWSRYQLVYDIRANELFDPDIFIRHYLNHNQSIRDYFRHRPADLLEINLKQPDSMKRVCLFLGVPWDGKPMPHENPSA